MASLPAHVPQRRPTHLDQSSSSSALANEAAHGTAQLQDQTDSTANQTTSPLVAIPAMQAINDTAAAAAGQAETSKSEPRHCWICLQDEDEEGSDNSAWRSPCPCNLQAHEECMLEWITDLEVPKSRRGGRAQTISCPQCKAEIQIERPRDVVVSAVDFLTTTGKELLLPAGLSALFGFVYSGSMIYGLNSLYLVFGKDYAQELLRQQTQDVSAVQSVFGQSTYNVILKLTEYTDPFMPMSHNISLKMFVGLPMVAPVLILSRTKLADYAFPLTSIALFAFPVALGSDNRNIRHWPPSPDLMFTILPFLRAAYNEFYKATFGDMVKRWDAAVLRKPREGETIEQVAQEEVQLVAEVQLGHHEVDVVPEAILGAEPNVNAEAAVAGRDEAEADPQQPDGPPAEAQAAADGDGADWEINARGIYPLDLLSTIMGALFFPAVSSLMGDLLFHTLPQAWVLRRQSSSIFSSILSSSSSSSSLLLWPLSKLPTTLRSKPSSTRSSGNGAAIGVARGLLQEKWGRSLVGGMLFVVIKDALVLYVKWKRARDQGRRRVVDYVRGGGR